MNDGDSRKISGCQGLQGRTNSRSTEDFQGNKAIPYDAVTIDILCVLYVTKTDS